MNYKQAFDGLNQAQTDLTVLQAVLTKAIGSSMGQQRESLNNKTANQVLTETAQFLDSLTKDMENWPREAKSS